MLSRFFLTLSFCSFAFTSFAEPVSITVFPNSAEVLDSRTVQVDSRSQFTFELPSDVQRTSVQLRSELPISNIQFEYVTKRASEQSTLSTKINKLQAEILQFEEQRSNCQKQVQFWTQFQTQNLTSSAEFFALSAEYRKQLESASECKLTTSQKLEDLRVVLENLRRKAQKTTTVLQVTGFVETSHSEFELNIKYRTTKISWISSFQLNLNTQNSMFNWVWSGEILQSSGDDWHNVEVFLATSERSQHRAIPALRPWMIDIFQEPQPRPMSKTLTTVSDMAMEAMPQALSRNVPNSRSVTGETPLFEVYEIGTYTLRTGKTLKIDILRKDFAAEFKYVYRPLLDTQAFLVAELLEPVNEMLPNGSTELTLDRQYMFTQHVKLEPGKLISFGNDPKLRMKQTSTGQSGQSGVFSKSKTRLWDWEFRFYNDHSKSKNVEVQLPVPQVKHSDIKVLSSQFSPEPTRDSEAQQYSWKLEIPANKSLKIDAQFKVEYPNETQLRSTY